MPRNALQNIRGFFSDYWLGSILSRRQTTAPKLTSAKLDRLLERISDLQERVSGPEPADLSTFRERFARPLLEETFGYAISEPDAQSSDQPRFRCLRPAESSAPADGQPALWLCPDSDALENGALRTTIERLMDERWRWQPESVPVWQPESVPGRGAC